MTRIVYTLMICGATAALVRAEEPDDDSGRGSRLKFVKEVFADFTLTKPGANDALSRRDEPVFRYSNPVRNSLSDGNNFLWLDGARPVAICALSIRGPESPPKVFREFTSLSAEPLELSREGQVVWRPRQGGLCNQAVPNADAPSDKPTARLTEMRAIARRFEAEFYGGEAPTQLRLLPQPIHRFQSPAQGALDGGLFAFVEASDPEVVLMIEARAAKKTDVSNRFAAQWTFTLARMTSQRLLVRLDGKEVFAPAAYWKNPRTLEDPYIEAFESNYPVDEPIIGKGG